MLRALASIRTHTLLLAAAAAAVAAATRPVAAATAPQAGDERAVSQVLTRSALAWDRGDLAGFMRSYEDSPRTVMVGRSAILHGYDAIRAHYAAHYGTTGMGVLTFTDLLVRPLGPGEAFAAARWHLALPDGTHPTGLTTLVFRHVASGWKIVADHSP